MLTFDQLLQEYDHAVEMAFEQLPESDEVKQRELHVPVLMRKGTMLFTFYKKKKYKVWQWYLKGYGTTLENEY